MFVTYEVYRDRYLEHHGKSGTEKINLCFYHAVKAAVDNREKVETKIVEVETYCDDCAK